jgi:hypothetical protein
MGEFAGDGGWHTHNQGVSSAQEQIKAAVEFLYVCGDFEAWSWPTFFAMWTGLDMARAASSRFLIIKDIKGLIYRRENSKGVSNHSFFPALSAALLSSLLCPVLLLSPLLFSAPINFSVPFSSLLY